MIKVKNTLKRITNTAVGAKARLFAAMTAAMTFMYSLPVMAADIQSSKLATGTEKLVKDATTWLLVIAPLITVVVVIYYFIRKSMADEMDHKKWDSRITTAIICCIGVVSASLIINVLISYYQ